MAASGTIRDMAQAMLSGSPMARSLAAASRHNMARGLAAIERAGLASVPPERWSSEHDAAIMRAVGAGTVHHVRTLLRAMARAYGVQIHTGLRYTASADGWQPWTREDYTRAMDRLADGPVRRAVQIAALTMLRQSDVLALTGEAVQPDSDGVLWVRVTPRKGRRHGARLDLPMIGPAADAARQWRAAGSRCIVSGTDTPMDAGAFRARYAREMRALGISAPFHGLRKYAMIRAAEGGMTAPQLQAWSGHAKLAHVQRYVSGADRARLALAGMERVQEHDRNTARVVGAGP